MTGIVRSLTFLALVVVGLASFVIAADQAVVVLNGGGAPAITAVGVCVITGIYCWRSANSFESYEDDGED